MCSSKPSFFSSSLIFLVATSFFGLFLVSVFTFNPPVLKENFVWRKPIVGLMFMSLCTLGIQAVIFPNECSKVFKLRKGDKSRHEFHGLKPDVSVSSGNSPLRGHHPDCRRFSSHVFHIGGRLFCATCTGLFFGAIVVLFGVFLYFFGGWQVGQHTFSIVWIGVLGVILGLLQSLLFTLHRSCVRVFSGAFLPIGSFLILMSIDELARNVFLDFFLFLLTLFWLVTRISLSKWEHERICSVCTLADCGFVDKINK